MDLTTLKALRERTGLSVGQCKEALVAAGGDVDRALDWLSDRGLYEAPTLTKPALREAVAKNDHERVARWLARGGAADETIAGQSLLHIACQRGALDVVRVLVAAGARTSEVVAGAWTASQLPALREIAAGAHKGLLLRALIASLSDRALVEGADAVLYLAEGLGDEKLEEPAVALRIAFCGCRDLMARWRDPGTILRRPLPEQEAARYAPLFGGTAPRNLLELLTARLAVAKGVVEVIEELKREGEHVDPGDEATKRARWLRLEACAVWLREAGLAPA